MEQRPKQSTENFIKEIRRKTRRLFSSEQKLVIVMEAQRGEYSIGFLNGSRGHVDRDYYTKERVLCSLPQGLIYLIHLTI